MELRKRRSSTPQKSSRLQPTEPLHMTTRGAVKASSHGSVSGSAASGSSRRSSLNDQAASDGAVPIGGNDIDSNRSSKRRRVASISKSTPSGSSQASQPSSSRSRISTRSGNGPLPPITETPIPRRRSKRLSDTTQENISVALPVDVSEDGEDGEDGTDDQEATEPTVSPPQSKRKRSSGGSTSPLDLTRRRSTRVSRRSSGISNGSVAVTSDVASGKIGDSSQGTEEDDEPTNTAIVEAVGVPTEVHLPSTIETEDHDSVSREEPSTRRISQRLSHSSRATSDSNSSADNASDVSENVLAATQDEQPVGSITSPEEEHETTGVDTIPIIATAASEDEATPLPSGQASTNVTPPRSVMNGLLRPKASPLSALDEAAVTEVDKPTKRLPGRRRAPHANPKVEAALRRQLHLRMAYRAVAKQLKPMLAELSQRTIKSLTQDDKAHEKSVEHEKVQAQLDDLLAARMRLLQRQHEFDQQKLRDTLEEELASRRRRHDHIVENLKEDLIVKLKHDFLLAVRRKQTKVDGYASDDEGDDVILPLHHVSHKGEFLNLLGSDYHWRSRPTLETERLFRDLEVRNAVQEDEGAYDEHSVQAPGGPFTVMDPVFREAALFEKNLSNLVSAAEQVQKQPMIPPPLPISNEEAIGLQILAAASVPKPPADPPAVEAAIKAKTKGETPKETPHPRPQTSSDSDQDRRALQLLSQPQPQPPPPPPPQQFTGWHNVAQDHNRYSQPRWPPMYTEMYPRMPPPETATVMPGINGLPPLASKPNTATQHQPGPSSTIIKMQPSMSPPAAVPTPILASPYSPSSAQPGSSAHSERTKAADVQPRERKNDFWSTLAQPGQDYGPGQSNVPGKVRIPSKTNGPRQSPGRRSSISSAAAPPQERRESQQTSIAEVDRSASDMRPPPAPLPSLFDHVGPRNRSVSDSFGPLLHGDDKAGLPQTKKPPAPKQSLYGPWPRGRNYDSLRRASISNAGSQPETSTSQGFSSFRPAESAAPVYDPRPAPQRQSYAPSWEQYPPTYTQAATSAPSYPPISQHAPPSHPAYQHAQHGSMYQTQQPSNVPTGYGMPPPQPYQHPPSSLYSGQHLPPAYAPGGPSQGYAPAPLGAYQGVPPPPVPSPYGAGQRFGGPPLLPAHGQPPQYLGGSGGPPGGSAPPPAQNSPAFAQYQQQDHKKRRNQSFGAHDRFQHYFGNR